MAAGSASKLISSKLEAANGRTKYSAKRLILILNFFCLVQLGSVLLNCGLFLIEGPVKAEKRQKCGSQFITIFQEVFWAWVGAEHLIRSGHVMRRIWVSTSFIVIVIKEISDAFHDIKMQILAALASPRLRQRLSFRYQMFQL